MSASGAWVGESRRKLLAEIGRVRARLQARVSVRGGGVELVLPDGPPTSGSAALEQIRAELGLSPFECDTLLLCAGVELDPAIPELCATLHGDPARRYPTFALAFDTLPGGDWDALTPVGPLRRWRLLEVGPGEALTDSPLRIDERTLHHLAGVGYLDERLEGIVRPVPPPASLAPTHRRIAEDIGRIWRRSTPEHPVILLATADGEAVRAIAAAGCAALGLRLHTMDAGDIPRTALEREALGRLWEREATFGRSALLLEDDGADDPAAGRAARAFLGTVGGLLLTTGGIGPVPGRLAVRLDIGPLPVAERRVLWESALGPLATGLNGQLDSVVAQFPLDASAIEATGASVLAHAESPDEAGPMLWDACRQRARTPLAGLAERIEPAAGWDDLVVPDEQRRTLREIASQVRQRAVVYETWGFAARGTRGLGIGALFAGPSGTGKTMAAEVIARELALDLFKIDLSQVVSKYIGETEKNLRAIFDAAEQSGAVLLFDEADALFGKRSEVKDSHDRYANIEVSYLLQRMEAYRGLAILTTNQRNALDPAFLRRLRFVVAFPFPDAALRARIWERVFPIETPTAELDATKLAHLSVAGGHIRNIALGAAFLAATEDEPVAMRHLLQAARSECAKLEKPLALAEIRGWV